jgi:adenosylcobinamide-GDP ribazoletransferase
MHAAHGFAVALQFLTRIPVRLKGYETSQFAASALWFPVVGVLIGGIVAGALWAGSRIDPWFGALAALAAWVLITGALHLDGLADLCDALGAAHRNPARFLEVLKDPHVGGFGVVAIALAIVAKIVLLMLCAKQDAPVAALVLAPSWARYGAYAWSQTLAPLSAGSAQRLARTGAAPGLVVSGLVLAAASVWVSPVLLIALPVLFAWWLFLKYGVGGMTGDCLGAGIELAEIALLTALVVATA